MKSKIQIITMIPVFCAVGLHATITWTPQTSVDGPFFAQKDGQLLLEGNSVWVGSFPEAFDYNASAANFELAELMNQFEVFATTSITDFSPPPFDPVGGGVLFGELTGSESFDNRRVHLFVFQTDVDINNQPIPVEPSSPDLTPIVAWGVFGQLVGSTLGGDWNFTDAGSGSSAEIDEFVAGAFLPGSESGENYDMLTLIPEPKIYAALFGLLSLGFALYRRRKPRA